MFDKTPSFPFYFRVILTFLFTFTFWLMSSSPVFAFTYQTGIVTGVPTEHSFSPPDAPSQQLYTQELHVKIQQETHTILYGSEFQPLQATQRLSVGTPVIVSYQEGENAGWSIVDIYRVPRVLPLFLLFFAVVIVVARWQGLTSFIGMFLSLFVLSVGLVPALMAGHNPLLVSLGIGAILAFLSIYLSHGWKLSSHLAFLSILLTLGLVGVLAYGSVWWLPLSGRGSEEALFLQFLPGLQLDLRGLLLGGMLLGAIGVLDDICVSQVAVVMELWGAKNTIRFGELFQRALRVGRSHVASLVNTLVLVYAGTNLPLFLLFQSGTQQPLWVTLNSEFLLEEVVRTLTGSIGLVIAVPLSTFLAAVTVLYLPQVFEGVAEKAGSSHNGHHHH